MWIDGAVVSSILSGGGDRFQWVSGRGLGRRRAMRSRGWCLRTGEEEVVLGGVGGGGVQRAGPVRGREWASAGVWTDPVWGAV